MREEVTKNLASEQCPDELELHLYLEGETEAPAAELIFHHLAHCQICAALLGKMRELRRFCIERLGEEELRETEFTQRVLQEVKTNLAAATAPQPRRRAWPRLNFWNRFSLAAAVVLAVVGGAFWFLAERQPGLSAKAVLEESEMRERLWEYQSSKVLHWVIEQTITNSPTMPDGLYRTLHWRSNVTGQAASLLRKYNQQNQLIFARWDKADGTEVVFRQSKDGAVCKVYPSLAVMRATLQGLPAEQRALLEKRFGAGRDLNDFAAAAEATAKSSRQSWDEGRLQIVNTPEDGQVFRIRLETPATTNNAQPEWVVERDMSVDTFRMLRLFTRQKLADGQFKTEDARWTKFREASLEELAANDLTTLMAQMKKIEHVDAQTLVQELLNRAPQRSEASKPGKQ